MGPCEATTRRAVTSLRLVADWSFCLVVRLDGRVRTSGRRQQCHGGAPAEAHIRSADRNWSGSVEAQHRRPPWLEEGSQTSSEGTRGSGTWRSSPPAASASASSGGGFARTSEHSGGTGPQAAVVALESSPYGPVLVVGGKGARPARRGRHCIRRPSTHRRSPTARLGHRPRLDLNATTQAVSTLEGGPDLPTGPDRSERRLARSHNRAATHCRFGRQPQSVGSVYRSISRPAR